MRVLIVGASRGVGRLSVDLARVAGHTVTALSRHLPKDAASLSGVHWVQGDATGAAALSETLAGQEAVLLAVGSKRMDGSGTAPIDSCSRATEALIPALEKLGRPRLIVVSSLGVGETRGKVPWLTRPLYVTLLKSRLDDKELQETRVRQSKLPWVILQPFVLSDGKPRGDIFVDATGRTRRYRISRADVAAFAVAQLSSDQYLRKSVALSG